MASLKQKVLGAGVALALAGGTLAYISGDPSEQSYAPAVQERPKVNYRGQIKKDLQLFPSESWLLYDGLKLADETTTRDELRERVSQKLRGLEQEERALWDVRQKYIVENTVRELEASSPSQRAFMPYGFYHFFRDPTLPLALDKKNISYMFFVPRHVAASQLKGELPKFVPKNSLEQALFDNGYLPASGNVDNALDAKLIGLPEQHEEVSELQQFALFSTLTRTGDFKVDDLILVESDSSMDTDFRTGVSPWTHLNDVASRISPQEYHAARGDSLTMANLLKSKDIVPNYKIVLLHERKGKSVGVEPVEQYRTSLGTVTEQGFLHWILKKANAWNSEEVSEIVAKQKHPVNDHLYGTLFQEYIKKHGMELVPPKDE